MKSLQKKTSGVPTSATTVCKSITKTVPGVVLAPAGVKATNGLPQLPPEFLLAFAVNLIRLSSYDAICIAANSAARATGVDADDAMAFIRTSQAELKTRGMFPPGFMPEGD